MIWTSTTNLAISSDASPSERDHQFAQGVISLDGPVARCQGRGVVETVYEPFGVGPFPVGVRTLQLTDGARGRQFPCELWYPAELSWAEVNPGGESRGAPPIRDLVPLVVFSHLSGGHRRSSTFLCRHLASHGYAVAALDHSEVVAPELAAPPQESASAREARIAAVVASRVPDLCFAVASLLDDRRGGDVRLEQTQVGVVGHSFGGWAALATPELESRIRAVVALAPGGASRPRPGILPVELSFAWGRDISTVFLTGDEDVMTPLDGVVELFERTPGSKRMFVVRGADHLHFLDNVQEAHESLRQATLPGEAAWIPAAMRPIAQLCPPGQAHEAIRGFTLAHLDATLRDDRTAEDFLEQTASDQGTGRSVHPLQGQPSPSQGH
jgi:dienelactone hydrolase